MSKKKKKGDADDLTGNAAGRNMRVYTLFAYYEAQFLKKIK